MKPLSLLLELFLICSFVQCNNAQKKATRKPAPVISDFHLNKEGIKTKDVQYINLGSFESEVPGSRQGSSVYSNYLVQAHDGAGVAVFDIPSRKVTKVGNLQPADKSNHCNNLCFSDRFYDSSDQFPLLYVSENHTLDIAVNRLSSLDSAFTLVQHITLPEAVGHYLNAVFDFQNNYIYTICYREKNWRTNDGNNHLVVSKLRLPDISEGNVEIEEIIAQFELPFRTATQGAFFANGYIVHGFGINTGTPDDALVVIDPQTQQVARVIGTHDVFQDEIEGVTPYGNGSLLVTLQHGDVYQVDFK